MMRSQKPTKADDETLPSPAVRPAETAKTGSREPPVDDLEWRGVPALLVDDDHRIQAANRHCVALFAGARLLGRRCYEVFHHRSAACERGGRRCPLRHYRETGEPCRVIHVHQGRCGAEHHEISIHASSRGDLFTCFELRPVEIASAQPSRSRLVGRTLAFNHMLELLLRAAARETPVLVLGEPGTCREDVARRLHQLDGKPAGAFVAVHCAGLRGARFGVELSRQIPEPPGTLYLGDVGDLAPPEQGELLRWLGRRQRAGLRLVCAARPDLRAQVVAGEFLDDLYYRISVFPIVLAPLRERREDLPLLAEGLLRQIGGDPSPELHPRTLALLEDYSFPGNLRELRRVLEHACLVAGSRRQILPQDLPPECRG